MRDKINLQLIQSCNTAVNYRVKKTTQHTAANILNIINILY